MKLSCKSALVAAVVACGLVSSANAAVLFNSGGFEGYTLGALDGQNGWNVFPDGTGGTGNTASAAGRFQVVSLGGTIGNAVRVAGGSINSITSAFAWPDIGYTPAAGEQVVVEADIARSVGTTSGTTSAGYYVDIFGLTGTRVARFGLGLSTNSLLPSIQVVSRFNTTSGQFDPAGGIFNVTVANGLTANAFYSFSAVLNFQTKSWDLNVNGAPFLTALPFVDLASTGLGDADLNVSSLAGRTDAGFYDNYKVYTVIPEPSALGLLAPAGLMMARRRRA